MPDRFRGPISVASLNGGPYENAPIEVLNPETWSFYVNDFHHADDYDTTTQWTQTDIGSPTAPAETLTPAGIGTLTFNAGTADDTGTQAQATVGVGALTTADSQVFCASYRFNTTDADGGGLLVGHAGTDTTLIGAADRANAVGAVGGVFFHATEAGTLDAITQRGTTPSTDATVTSTGITLADSTYVEVGYRVQVADISDDNDNGFVTFYKRVGGVWISIATVQNSLPNGAVSPSLAVVNETGDVDLVVDKYAFAIQR